jgi:hypothetical protein
MEGWKPYQAHKTGWLSALRCIKRSTQCDDKMMYEVEVKGTRPLRRSNPSKERSVHTHQRPLILEGESPPTMP